MRAVTWSLALALSVAACTPAEPQIRIVSHRGVPGLAPENSLEGVAKAVELGLDAVELDVRRDPDGVLVLHHNPVYSATEVQSRPPARGDRVLPSLGEALQIAGDRIGLVLDLKDAALDEAVALVRDSGHTGLIGYVVYLPSHAGKLRRLSPRSPVFLSCDPLIGFDGIITELAKAHPGVILSASLAFWTSGRHREDAWRRGTPICISVLDSQEPRGDLGTALGLRPAFILTDHPLLLRSLLGKGEALAPEP